MNNEIQLTSRSLAAFLYSIGMIPMGSVVAFSLNNNSIFQNYSSIASTLIIYGIVIGSHTVFYTLVLSGLLWIFTKAKHPFVARSGRYAFHYALNALIMRVFYIFVFSMTCGVVAQSISDTLMSIYLVIIICIEIAYFMNSLIASILALRGYHFENSFITPFIKPE
jgi:uncharacterized Tic20 family protein